MINPKSWPWHMLSAPPSRRLRASTSIQEIIPLGGLGTTHLKPSPFRCCMMLYDVVCLKSPILSFLSSWPFRFNISPFSDDKRQSKTICCERSIVLCSILILVDASLSKFSVWIVCWGCWGWLDWLLGWCSTLDWSLNGAAWDSKAKWKHNLWA